MRYYIVTCKCGHVGRNKYIPIDFAVKADSASDAAARARQLPRVKHDHKDAILSVREVDLFDFSESAWINGFDPYLICTSRREQIGAYDGIYHRVLEEEIPDRCRKDTPNKPVYAGKKRIRNVRRFAREQAFSLAADF